MRRITLLLFIVWLMPILSITAQEEAEYTLRYDGLPRSYVLHLPPQYDGETLLPVVFVLHGGGGNAEHADLMSDFAAKGDEEGFITVYPNGTGRFNRQNTLLTWNAGFCCSQARDKNVDDVGFFAELIDTLLATYAIDPNRVYVTGMSNGAMMTQRLGGQLSDRIAAIASVAGAAGGQQTPESDLIMVASPSDPLNVLLINALDDEAVPYAGGQTSLGTVGEEFVVISAEESLAFWQGANACPPDAGVTNVLVTGIATEEIFACDSGAEVALVTATEGGHSWPGSALDRRRGDDPTQALNATDIIWDFFASHLQVTD
ncbi:MAG: polyhydroxybutyrate depolymerase [Anaerolineaceae bacterium]|nr:polyhydroxybutyrate depolymerase [Anaerolineaceae bacterium]